MNGKRPPNEAAAVLARQVQEQAAKTGRPVTEREARTTAERIYRDRDNRR
jgi:hypothetical protein